MDPDGAREVLRRLSQLYVPDETRALLYEPGPRRIADSDLIAGAVEEIPLGRSANPLAPGAICGASSKIGSAAFSSAPKRAHGKIAG
jgi:hypothetical protein